MSEQENEIVNEEEDIEMDKDLEGQWSVMGVWNEQLTFGREERKLEPRSHIWASEIGKNHYERYLKMNGLKPDFDYNERTLRKFAAGDFFERIIGYVLVSSGLLKHDNKRYEVPEDDEHLMVSVKPDFIAGGKPNWEDVKKDIESNGLFELMPTMKNISKNLVELLSKKYQEGMADLVYEIKSVNSQVFWSKKDYLKDAYPHHKMQLFTGMKATDLTEGRILYISKDDLTVAEFPIKLTNPELNKLWDEDVRLMTQYIRDGREFLKKAEGKYDLEFPDEGDAHKYEYMKEKVLESAPPKPDSVVFNERKKLRFQYQKEKYVIQGCYVPNWEIEWSNYLPTITGFESVDKWLESIKDEIKTKNEQLKDSFKEKIITKEK